MGRLSNQVKIHLISLYSILFTDNIEIVLFYRMKLDYCTLIFFEERHSVHTKLHSRWCKDDMNYQFS